MHSVITGTTRTGAAVRLGVLAVLLVAALGAIWLTRAEAQPGALTAVTMTPAEVTLAEGESATITLALNGDPGEAIDVNVRSKATRAENNDITISPEWVSWTAANWQEERTVTVTARADDVGEADEEWLVNAWTYRPGERNSPLFAKSSVELTIDSPELLVATPSSASLFEWDNVRVSLTLTRDPGEAVTVQVTSDGIATDDVLVSPATVSWRAGQWQQTRIVTIRAQNTSTLEDPETHTVNFNGTGAADTSVEVTIREGVNIAAGSVGPGSLNLPGTSRVAYGSTVTITATPDAGKYLQDWGYACNSTPATSRTCTFTANARQISVNATFGATPYNPTTLTGLTLSVDDTDLLEGDTATLTLSLDSDPGEAVDVVLSLPDAAAGNLTLSATTVSWTAAGWDTDKTVTLTAVEDTTDEEPATYTLEARTYQATDTARAHYVLRVGTADVEVQDKVTLTTSVTGDGALDFSGTTEHARGAVVTITATPETNKYLTGWGGACANVVPTLLNCYLTLGADTTVSATFGDEPPQPEAMLISEGEATELVLEWVGGPSSATAWEYRTRFYTSGSPGDWTSWTAVPSSTGTTRSYTLTGLKVRRGYEAQVRPVTTNAVHVLVSNVAIGSTQWDDGTMPTINSNRVIEGDGTTRWRVHEMTWSVLIPDGMRIKGGPPLIALDGTAGVPLIDLESGSILGLSPEGRELGRIIAPTPAAAPGVSGDSGPTTPARDVGALFDQIVESGPTVTVLDAIELPEDEEEE